MAAWAYGVCSCGQPAKAQTSAPALPPQTPATFPRDALTQRIAKIEKKLAEKEKDIWDKISSVSGLASGVLIALIGALATYVYNERQRQLQRARDEREISVSQAQTIQSFIPHLTSENPTEVRAALLAVEAMGDPELATKLARLFGGEGSLGALYRMSQQREHESKQSADAAIGDLLATLKPSVVQIRTKEGRFSATGFFIDNNGHVVTTAHVVRQEREFVVRTLDGKTHPAKVVRVDPERDLAVLHAPGVLSHPLRVSPAAQISVAQQVAIIAHTATMKWQARVGTVRALTYRDNRTLIEASDLRPEPGYSGAPVLDQTGKVVGVMAMSDWQSGISLLISGEDIQTAFPDMMEGDEKEPPAESQEDTQQETGGDR